MPKITQHNTIEKTKISTISAISTNDKANGLRRTEGRLKKRPQLQQVHTETVLPFFKKSLKLNRKVKFPDIENYYNIEKGVNNTNVQSYIVLNESFCIPLNEVEKIPLGDITTLREIVISENKASAKVFLQSRLTNTGNTFLIAQIEYNYFIKGSQHTVTSNILHFLPDEWINVTCFVDAQNYSVNENTVETLDYTVAVVLQTIKTLESCSQAQRVSICANFTRKLSFFHVLRKAFRLQDKINILPCTLQNKTKSTLHIKRCNGCYHDRRLDML